MKLPDPVTLAIPGFVLLVLAEMLVAWARDRSRYCPRDTLTSLLLGLGSGPGEVPYDPKKKPASGKKAVKCDMCKDLAGGAACVRACPTGAAIRISPEEFPAYAQSRR